MYHIVGSWKDLIKSEHKTAVFNVTVMFVVMMLSLMYWKTVKSFYLLRLFNDRPGNLQTEESEIEWNIERPGPKTKSESDCGDMDGVCQLLVNVSSKLENVCLKGSLPGSIALLNEALRVHGAKLEESVDFDLNQFMGTIMTSFRYSGLDMASKLYLLEIVELHNNKWVMDTTTTDRYSHFRSKLTSLEGEVKITLLCVLSKGFVFTDWRSLSESTFQP